MELNRGTFVMVLLVTSLIVGITVSLFVFAWPEFWILNFVFGIPMIVLPILRNNTRWMKRWWHIPIYKKNEK